MSARTPVPAESRWDWRLEWLSVRGVRVRAEVVASLWLPSWRILLVTTLPRALRVEQMSLFFSASFYLVLLTWKKCWIRCGAKAYTSAESQEKYYEALPATATEIGRLERQSEENQQRRMVLHSGKVTA